MTRLVKNDYYDINEAPNTEYHGGHLIIELVVREEMGYLWP